MYQIKVVSYDKKNHTKLFIDGLNLVIFEDLNLAREFVVKTCECFHDLILEVICK